MSATIRRPTIGYDLESYGTRWSDDPALADVFHPDARYPDLDARYDSALAALRDGTARPQHHEPVIDAQQLDDFLAYQSGSDPFYASDGVTD